VLLAEELRRASANPEHDAAELFRRMCFNALISNIDDHPRNHAIIAKNRDWKLSPAYDLTPATPVSIERRDLALSIGDAGRYANAENILSQSLCFLLKREPLRLSHPVPGIMRSKLCSLGKMVGVAGFEPTTSSSRTKRASQAALHPDLRGQLTK
jgi:serine/threonine-protein kinase HipA